MDDDVVRYLRLASWSLYPAVMMVLFFRVRGSASRWLLGIGLGLHAAAVCGLFPGLQRLLRREDWAMAFDYVPGIAAPVLMLVGALVPQPKLAEDAPIPPGAFPTPRAVPRSYWGFIGLSIVTLGVWWWIHFFQTTGELRRAMRTRGQEQAARDAGAWLVLLLVITVLSGIGTAMTRLSIEAPYGRSGRTSDFYELVVPTVRAGVFTIFATGVFWCLYMRAVDAARQANDPRRESRAGFGVLVGFTLPLNLAVSILSCCSSELATILTVVTGLALLVLSLMLLYVVIEAANRVWTQVPAVSEAAPHGGSPLPRVPPRW